MTLHANQLHAAKPDSVENDFSRVEMTADGLVIHNERYKTRVRMSNQVISSPIRSTQPVVAHCVAFCRRLR